MNIIWTPGVTMEQIEREIIIACLKHNRGNKTHTAASLGIAYRTLDDKLKKYTDDQELIQKLAEERRNERSKLASSKAGLHIQPAPEDQTKRPMPMQLGKEMEEVSQKPSPANNSNSRNSKKNGAGEQTKGG